MSYPKPYWIPSEEEYGTHWRNLVNLLLHKQVDDFDTIKTIVYHYYEFDPDARRFELPGRRDLDKDLKDLRIQLDFWHENEQELRSDIVKAADASYNVEKPVYCRIRNTSDTIGDPEKTTFFSGLCIYKEIGFESLRKRYRLPNESLAQHYSKDSEAHRGRVLYLALTSYLQQVLALEQFRDLAVKCWSDARDSKRILSWEELDFLNEFYMRWCLSLSPPDRSKPWESCSLENLSREYRQEEESRYYAPEVLHNLIDQVLLWAVTDLVDAILHYHRFRSDKGSFLCEECGQFFPRSFYGHGQKYCSKQCKERAKKQRRRSKGNC